MTVFAVTATESACAGCGWHEDVRNSTFPGMTTRNGAVSDALGVFPAAFVWTKMQAEAGQGLADIVRRKELERALGGGQFWWGIGNPLGDTLTRLVARDPAPPVLFSIMRGRPKREDAAPEAVVLWTAYLDPSTGRLAPLPPHVLVTSRAASAGGDKRRHYALVCHADRPLRLDTLGELDATHYRNLGSEASRVGASQVTAVVEHREHIVAPRTSQHVVALGEPRHGSLGASFAPDDDRAASTGSAPQSAARGAANGTGVGQETAQRYEVNLRATLDRPYFVRLARPVLISDDERATLDATARAADTSAWAAFVRSLRERADTLASRVPADDLFG